MVWGGGGISTHFIPNKFGMSTVPGMETEDKEKLRKNLVSLVDGLVLDEVFIASLQSEGILTQAMVEELLTKPAMTKRVSHFVSSLLPRRGPRAFEMFIKTCVGTGQVRSVIL